jgi:hypothetical protein
MHMVRRLSHMGCEIHRLGDLKRLKSQVSFAV